MIPKQIHYCWFGGNEKPAIVEKCIKSWEKFFPDFEIIEWNENNFDVHCCTYVEKAYQCKKWAFVSDYARFFILEKYGGMYFDTDVEVVRSFAPLLIEPSFCGFETENFINPGLVMWSLKPNNPIFQQMLELYHTMKFLDESGKPIKGTVCTYFTALLSNYGFIPNNQKQTCAGITLFPIDYFNPFDTTTGVLNKTKNTYAIHWYSMTWMPSYMFWRLKITRFIRRTFSVNKK